MAKKINKQLIQSFLDVTIDMDFDDYFEKCTPKEKKYWRKKLKENEEKEYV